MFLFKTIILPLLGNVRDGERDYTADEQHMRGI